ncbi:flagelliform silk protein, putative [Trichomonas vaginalis G3]|uniref:receptor protein-tyrosine kinase n=1 Tax=Trichomonas vaginalis (strain ATCC PRA-98 / G3) TaxID=412133 RepID=A2FN93_TRIV3|nr:glycine-rich protein family [Trichomonas vaginalis G3]EAX93621.1 flagelliform silk protein, putative [Trichomonas vaginalis G3]KAI5496134.1 glycine-rich protein family [Trichomonas vaginalis G3]|eukprot:XP_001306551.1 flagelliform silk protein [Trichomonas vaginalis G3]
MYLYLGGKGQDQDKTIPNQTPTQGGWNFGGNGGVEYTSETGFAENGAGGGGAVDIRLEYIDINKDKPDQNILKKSIESRIIVAGSGGGASSGEEFPLGKIDGFPGGNISAISNGIYVLGGSQTSGTLGIGHNGRSSSKNEGASGGCGSGYRGGINKLPSSSNEGYFQIGGTGGSSYVSGHFGCISPSHQNDIVANNQNSIHESGYKFINTKMISGQEKMPSPFNDSFIFGNIGNGIGRITFLYAYIQTCVIFKSNYYLYMFLFTAISTT